jgi:hypothetical protein
MYDMRAIQRFGSEGPVSVDDKPSLMRSMVTSFLFRMLSTLSSKNSRGGNTNGNGRNQLSSAVAEAVRTAEDHMILAQGGVGILSWTEVIRSLVVWTLDTTNGKMGKFTAVERDWIRKKWKKTLKLLLNVARFIVGSRRKCKLN